MRVIVLDDDGSEMLNVSARLDDATDCLFPGQDELNTVGTCLTRALSLLMPGLPGEHPPEMIVTVDGVSANDRPERPSYLKLVPTDQG